MSSTAIDRGMSQREAAETFDLARATIVKWLRLRRETGDIEPMPHGGGNPARARTGTKSCAVAPSATRRPPSRRSKGSGASKGGSHQGVLAPRWISVQTQVITGVSSVGIDASMSA